MVCPASLPSAPTDYESPARVRSLEGYGGAGALQGSLGLLRDVLGYLLQNHLRSAVNDVLGLLQTEAREGAHLLDDLNLLVAYGLQDDVELVLLLDLGGSSRAAAGSSNGNRGRSGDIEGVLEQFHELGELDEGHCLERLDELVSAELCHGGSSFLVVRSDAVSGVGGGSRRREPVASALVATRGDVLVDLDDSFCRRLDAVLGNQRRTLCLDLGPQGLDHSGRLRQRSREQVDSVAQRCLHGSGQLGQEDLAGLEVRELGDLLGRQGLAVQDAGLDHEEWVCLGEVTQALGRPHRITGDEGDRGRAREQTIKSRDSGFLGCDLGKRVLHDGVGSVLANAATQGGQLRHGQAAVLREHGRTRAPELVRQLGDGCCLFGLCHWASFRNEMPEKALTNKRSPGAGAGLTAYPRGMPVTDDPALVARMLRNLRSACKEQVDNRRSLVGPQRTCPATTVKIGPLSPFDAEPDGAPNRNSLAETTRPHR